MPIKANVNSEILKWARKTAKISLEKAASVISKTCNPERIKEWESPDGKDRPSIKQAEKLARLYRRPVDVFFLKYIPKDFKPLKDFRINKEDGLSTSLIFMMREIQEKQEWLSKFLSGRREKKLDFVGKYTIKSSVQEVANDIRNTLGIRLIKTEVKPLKYWIEKAESKGIFISLSSNYHTRLKLDSDIFKGFVITDKFAPFIFLNADDWEHGQLVSLVHELVHVWINVSGISNETEIRPNHPMGTHIVEKFCREVTELALMPKEIVAELLKTKGELNLKNVSRAARKLGVSNEALLIRAGKTELIEDEKLNSLRKEAAQAWKDFLYKESQKPKSMGGPNYYIMQLRRSSKAFSNIVMGSYKSGKLKGDMASRLLSVKESNFVKFEKYIYK